ncbi:hypothetical protein [Pyrobaculum ferrireducens]|uniref:PaREP6 n=1 Tax=Pyrobaculum ferrireducens TaxID=1104324 RepID=G7VFT6_9CREN|nr:hypothetical protein [Pyrobaculum ferrireducens]AET31743.1 hypothetical protein P186_0285 [Pyrobaculum ferrireducens]
MAEWLELLKEAREIRRREADWDFINRQPPKLKYALIYYVETGDIYVASRIAGMRVEQFDGLRRRAKIPTV